MKRPQNILEKIISLHTKETFKTGDFLLVDVDFTLANDITAPVSIKEFYKYKFKRVFNKDKIALIPDHFTPSKDIKSAENVKLMREFAKKFNITHFYEPQKCGIEHVFLPEKGLVLPSQIVIGADSHTCTYGALGSFAFGVGSTDIVFSWVTGKIWIKVPPVIKIIYQGKLKKFVTSKDVILFTLKKLSDKANYKVLEFTGTVIERMSQSQRFTLSNMATEAGAKTGLINPDKITLDFLKSIGKLNKKIEKISYMIRSDLKAEYEDIYEWDLSKLNPQVAVPFLPSNVKDVDKVKVNVDQVVIGSCTNGRLEDLMQAAQIFKKRKVNSRVRCLIFPGSPKVLLEAEKLGLIEIFLKAECVICPPTCGPCLGGHLGVLAEGEVCAATTNRNFIGRMGHKNSKVYLVNPYVAAASAVKGKITHPESI